MPELFTDLETLAKSTGLIHGEVGFVLWANEPPKILVAHPQRGDVDPSRTSVDCSITFEPVTEALRGDLRGMESDIVMDGKSLDTWTQFRPTVGDEAIVFSLKGSVATKSTGMSEAKTYRLDTARALTPSGRTTCHFGELCRKNRCVDIYFMAAFNPPRLKGEGVDTAFRRSIIGA